MLIVSPIAERHAKVIAMVAGTTRANDQHHAPASQKHQQDTHRKDDADEGCWSRVP